MFITTLTHTIIIVTETASVNSFHQIRPCEKHLFNGKSKHFHVKGCDHV